MGLCMSDDNKELDYFCQSNEALFNHNHAHDAARYLHIKSYRETAHRFLHFDYRARWWASPTSFTIHLDRLAQEILVAKVTMNSLDQFNAIRAEWMKYVDRDGRGIAEVLRDERLLNKTKDGLNIPLMQTIIEREKQLDPRQKEEQRRLVLSLLQEIKKLTPVCQCGTKYAQICVSCGAVEKFTLDVEDKFHRNTGTHMWYQVSSLQKELELRQVAAALKRRQEEEVQAVALRRELAESQKYGHYPLRDLNGLDFAALQAGIREATNRRDQIAATPVQYALPPPLTSLVATAPSSS